MKIEFLYFEGCPSWQPALDLLQKILKEEGLDSSIEMIAVESDEMADELKFLGSPTIRINGKDVSENYETLSESYSHQCRVYNDNGILKGIPPQEWIRNKITEDRQG